jgi:hypothetical protein
MRTAGFAAVVLAATLLCAQDRDNQNPPAVPGWHATLAEGLKDAEGSGKPLMVVFR